MTGKPQRVIQFAMGEPAYDIYSRSLKERTIFLVGQVNDKVASLVTAQHVYLEAKKPNKNNAVRV